MSRSRDFRDSEVLEDSDLAHLAPSIFTDDVDLTVVSERYTQVPTIRVLNVLHQEGWMPVKAGQSSCRNIYGAPYVKHMIRLRQTKDIGHKLMSVGQCVPELVLTNSHDGTSSFRLMAGIFRLVCMNGMVVADSTFADYRIPHKGYADSLVMEASYRIIKDVPLITDRIKEFQSVRLGPAQRTQFAVRAAMLRWRNKTIPEMMINPMDLLTARRLTDNRNDLWTVYNNVQENLMKGGLQGKKGEQRTRVTHKISTVNEDLRINRGLWMLADELYKSSVTA